MRRSIKNILVGLFIVAYIVVYRLFIIKNLLKYNEFITASFTIVLFALGLVFYGYRKIIKNYLNKALIKNTFINIIVYFLVIYGCGLLIGFLSNSYSLKPMAILDNVFPLLVIIVFTELFRYVFIRSNKDKKIHTILITTLLIALEVSLYVRYDSFGSGELIFKFTTITILPIAMKNILCSYFVYHNDYRSNLLYRLLVETYIYMAPIIPDFNDYFMSVVGLILPFVILIRSIKISDEFSVNKTRHIKPLKPLKKSNVVLFVIVILLVMLVKGFGPLQILAIESPSMSPSINVGDAVIINKNYSKDKLKKNDVIAYKNKDGLIIVHRIINVNNDETFITKGDQNNTADFDYVSKDMIVGKVILTIPYIAYPNIFIRGEK